MEGFDQILAYGAACVCLGVWLTLMVITALTARYSEDVGETRLGFLIGLPFFVLAAYLFIVAVQA